MVGGEAPVIATSLDINVYVLEPAKAWLEVPEESDWLDRSQRSSRGLEGEDVLKSSTKKRGPTGNAATASPKVY